MSLIEKAVEPIYNPKLRQRIYDMKPAPDEFIMPKSLDEKAIYYDIKERNKKILNVQSQGGQFGGNADFGDFDI